MAETGPLIADTTGEVKPVLVEQKISTAAIQVTIDCSPTLPRSNPASKSEGVEGGDAVSGKAEKIGVTSTSEAVGDGGARNDGDTVNFP